MTSNTRRRKIEKKEAQPSFFQRNKFALIKSIFLTVACGVLGIFGYLLHLSYLDYIDPDKIYGEWIEIGAPPYQTEVLLFSADGVFRNNRFVATNFEFDGKLITLNTGLGKTVYQISGSHLSPQIRRIEPRIPDQRFILKGFEHTVQGSDIGSASKRRAALSEHFGNK
ncbi:DUF2850 domain-containing protein [Vibrio rotiferianus]|uniref:DUF2850 domain-containing protein n=1 Tax=Vibrio rotiferianus TaxID=190895 RepID=UPI0015F49F9B|nr:DUF2850 domain-containing protein [Vibrio rotiferianus]